MTIKVSILIRTKDEVDSIERTLQLLDAQLMRPCDVIVVDSGSTDGTLECVQQWGGVRLISIPACEFTYGRALNIGCEAAQGDIVVALSTHAFPRNEYWLENLTKHFDDPRVAGVYGRQLPNPDAWPSVARDYLACYGVTPRVQKNPDEVRDHFFSNANASFRRNLWQKRPFAETLPYAEDWEWARGMLRLGYTIIYEPKAEVYHSHNELPVKHYRRMRQEYEAYKLMYDRRKTILGACMEWLDKVRGDITFILRNGEARGSLLWAPVYRLFGVLGSLRPSLPDALWQPVSRCFVRLRAKRRTD